MQPVIIMMMPPGYPNQQFHHPIATHYNPAPTVPFQYHHMPIHNECHQQRRKVFCHRKISVFICVIEINNKPFNFRPIDK